MTLNSTIGSLGNSIFYNLLNRAQSYSNPGEWQNKSRADFFYFQRDSLNQLTKFLFQRYHIKIPPEVFIIFEILSFMSLFTVTDRILLSSIRSAAA